MDAARRRAVILRHELPDASWHYDWMLEPPAAGAGLITFRAAALPGEITHARLERLADHRPIYLEYEGPLTDNRGSVRRVAAGWCLWRTCTPAALEAELGFDAWSGRLAALQEKDAWWDVRLERA